jgi:hypothetical protein
MKKIENEEKIMFFLTSLTDKEIEENAVFDFKKELTQVIFEPRNKQKRNRFCKQMGMDVFEAILIDLELPFTIKTIKESPQVYMVKKEE